MNTYGRIEQTFVSGDGVWLTADDQEVFLDALSGIAVCSLGHSHPEISKVLCDQGSTLIHTSNVNPIPQQTHLAAKLSEVSGLDQVFFANSGAEANEAALKLSRLHARKKGIDSPQIVVFEQAFHGRTLATLSASDSEKVQKGFEPLVEGFIRLPFNDMEALLELPDQYENIVAIMVEPIQGEGGVRLASPGYLSAIRSLCDQQDWLMIADEIQTGVGRTGRWYAYQHEDILPDIVTTAKALGSGLPIGACMAKAEIAAYFKPGKHGSTFGGNPLACAVALKTLEVMEETDLIQHCLEMGAYLQHQLDQALGERSDVIAIRGKGLMIGIEFDRNVSHLMNLALEERVIINVTREKIVRLLPPLILEKEQADELVIRLSRAVSNSETIA